MEYRSLGNTELRVSAIGFGCGAVGGLMIKGSPAERARAVACAVDLGVTYFDTAAAYGSGTSESNLGQALAETGAEVVVGTKIVLAPEDLNDIDAAVERLVDQSLRRLGRDRVDLMQLHNPIGIVRGQNLGWLALEDVSRVLQAFSRLGQMGKLRFWGINGLGDIAAVQRAVARDQMHSIQICHNLLNPTAAVPSPEAFPFPDQRRLIGKAAALGTGVIAFRILAGGALSGTVERHSNASRGVETIVTSSGYETDVQFAQRLNPVIASGFAGDLVEASIRFAVGTPGVSMAVVGVSTVDQMEQAVRHAGKGPLPEAALQTLEKQWAGFRAP